jgi:hypothetical protein
MSGPIHRVGGLVAIAGLLLASCGGGSGPAGSDGGSSNATTTPPAVTHAAAVSLLPAASDVAWLIKPSATPSRDGETLSSVTLSSAFSSAVPRTMRLAAGTAELDVVGRAGTFLYVHVFVFKTLAGAELLTPTFLSSTRLGMASGQPSGAPGQQGEASSQPYGSRQVSYRYAFRDDNVLSYVELDGPRGKYSRARVTRLAAIEDQRIRAALG